VPVITPQPLPLSHRELALKARKVIVETVDIAAVGPVANAALSVSGTLRASLVGLQAGVRITNLTVQVTNAGVGMTHWWHAIWDSSLNLVANTADSATSVQSTGNITLALASAYTPTLSGGYYLGYLGTTGTSMPTLAAGTSGAYSQFGGAIGTGLAAAIQQTGLSALPNPAVAASASLVVWIAAT
jgi:hypothetical protein